MSSWTLKQTWMSQIDLSARTLEKLETLLPPKCILPRSNEAVRVRAGWKLPPRSHGMLRGLPPPGPHREGCPPFWRLSLAK
eukprot:4687304-Alexandrium_andersonii.AAC.1